MIWRIILPAVSSIVGNCLIKYCIMGIEIKSYFNHAWLLLFKILPSTVLFYAHMQLFTLSTMCMCNTLGVRKLAISYSEVISRGLRARSSPGWHYFSLWGRLTPLNFWCWLNCSMRIDLPSKLLLSLWSILHCYVVIGTLLIPYDTTSVLS